MNAIVTSMNTGGPEPDVAAPPATGMDRRIARPHRGRRAAAAAGMVALLGALGVYAARALPQSGSLVVMRADLVFASATAAPYEDVLPVRAEVAPLETVYVTAVQGGQVEAVLAAEGARVAQGAVLAALSNPQLELDVVAREAEIAGRLSDVSAQQLQMQRNRLDRDREVRDASYGLLKARRELELRRPLHAKAFISDAQLKTLLDEAAYHQARLDALNRGRRAEDAIAAAQARQIDETGARLRSTLGVVRGSLDALAVRAPAAGRLTGFDLRPGQSLAPGDRLGQIDSEDAFKLVAEVDEFYLSRVAPGQRAAAAAAEVSHALVVDRVIPQVTDGRFRVELAFEGGRPVGLKRGQTLDLRITLGDTRRALVLPSGPWLETSGGAYAFVLDPDGRGAERRPVRLGRRSPMQVEVTGGLQPGERVVTSSYADFGKHTRLILR